MKKMNFESAADGLSGVISGLSFAQPSKKPNLHTSERTDYRQSQIAGKRSAIKNKFNAMRRKRIIEALAYGERDSTQRRVRSDQDNVPGTEVGVKSSQTIPTRDLNDESGINNKNRIKKIKESIISDIGSKESGKTNRKFLLDKTVPVKIPSIENNQESGNVKKVNKIKEEVIDEALNFSSLKNKLSDWANYVKSFFYKQKQPPPPSSKDYIWRTQEDEKVRDLHQELEGKRFNMDDPPVSGTSGFRGNPGEPANCRCYAEPIKEESINIVLKHLNERRIRSCLY